MARIAAGLVDSVVRVRAVYAMQSCKQLSLVVWTLHQRDVVVWAPQYSSLLWPAVASLDPLQSVLARVL